MKTFRVKQEHEHDVYSDDIVRIQSVLRANDLDCSFDQARELWEAHSESMAAGWLHLPDEDGDIYPSLRPYIELENEDE